MGGILLSYPRAEGCLDPELMQHSFSVLVCAFLVVVMAVVNSYGAGGCVTEHANA